MCLLGFVLTGRGRAADDPDALFKKGRFREAEEVYRFLEINNPEEFRYRYNRGCAAYRQSNFTEATAAFASVLARAKDQEIRFRAAYNLGHIAYQTSDFSQATAFFREALKYNPTHEDAKVNLDLALKALEREEKKRERGSQKAETSGAGKQSSRDAQGEREGSRESGQQEASQEKASPTPGSPGDKKGIAAGRTDSPLMERQQAVLLIEKVREGHLQKYGQGLSKGMQVNMPSGKDW